MSQIPQPFGVARCPVPPKSREELRSVLFTTIYNQPSLIMLAHMTALRAVGINVGLVCGCEARCEVLPQSWQQGFEVHQVEQSDDDRIAELLSRERISEITDIFPPWKYIAYYPRFQSLQLHLLVHEAQLYVGGEMFSAVASLLAGLYHAGRAVYLIQGTELSDEQTEEDKTVLVRFQLDLVESIDHVMTCHTQLSDYFASLAAIRFPVTTPVPGVSSGARFASWADKIVQSYRKLGAPEERGTVASVCFENLVHALRVNDTNRLTIHFPLLERICAGEER